MSALGWVHTSFAVFAYAASMFGLNATALMIAKPTLRTRFPTERACSYESR